MSGPGLEQRETHQAIHRAAFVEAEQLTRLLRSVAKEPVPDRALAVADILIEHWETRILAHAEAEEAGLYTRIAQARPREGEIIHGLIRDHDMLRRLTAEIQTILASQGWTDGIVERFEAMLLVNSIHSRDEEAFLFSRDEVNELAEND